MQNDEWPMFNEERVNDERWTMNVEWETAALYEDDNDDENYFNG